MTIGVESLDEVKANFSPKQKVIGHFLVRSEGFFSLNNASSSRHTVTTVCGLNQTITAIRQRKNFHSIKDRIDPYLYVVN